MAAASKVAGDEGFTRLIHWHSQRGALVQSKRVEASAGLVVGVQIRVQTQLKESRINSRCHPRFPPLADHSGIGSPLVQFRAGFGLHMSPCIHSSWYLPPQKVYIQQVFFSCQRSGPHHSSLDRFRWVFETRINQGHPSRERERDRESESDGSSQGRQRWR